VAGNRDHRWQWWFGERDEREGKEIREKKVADRTDIGTRTLASLAPYCVIRAPTRMPPFLPTWRIPGASWIPRAPSSLVFFYAPIYA
jgi:hypothetical protein